MFKRLVPLVVVFAGCSKVDYGTYTTSCPIFDQDPSCARITLIEKTDLVNGVEKTTSLKYKIVFNKPGEYLFEGWKYGYRSPDSLVKTFKCAVLNRDLPHETIIQISRIDRLECLRINNRKITKASIKFYYQGQ